MKENKRKHSVSIILVICLLFLQAGSLSVAYADALYAFNNGYLRFGTGSETSINSAGNLMQPFYYYAPDSAWYQLTYSDYALNSAIGVGGDGTSSWNMNGTISIDGTLSSHNLDTSSFSDGWGTIISTGTLDVGGSQIEVQNTYMLPQSEGFIKILTKVTNESASAIENVRYWVGTQDDYLDGSDRPTKERGNIADGEFTAIANASDRAGAIKIYNSRTCAFFFSSSDRANTSIYSTYSYFGNVISQNPATSPILETGDDSYSMYVRMNDLAPGESDEFIWYYAAGEVGDLSGVFESISDDVAAEGQPKVSLSTSESSVSEEPDTVTITATLSELVAGDVTVNLAYSGTASSETDYNAGAATITIDEGELTGTTTVGTLQDLIAEGDETIIVDVDSVVNAAENGTQRVTITIVDDDEAPVISSSGTATLAEGSDGLVYTGVATDGDGEPITWSISGGGDAASFEIDEMTGELTFTGLADYETKNTYTVIIAANDGTNTTTKTITLQITNVNETPTDIALSNNSILEESPVGTMVGSLSTQDVDAGDSFTYAFVAGEGAADNALFSIDGNDLEIGFLSDYETKNTYTVRIRSTDSGDETFEKAFAITIIDGNDRPVITSAGTAGFTSGRTGIVYIATATDDNGDTLEWSISGVDAAKFNIESDTGVLTFVSPPSSSNPEDDDQDNIYNITVTVSDGSLLAEKDLAVTVRRRPAALEEPEEEPEENPEGGIVDADDDGTGTLNGQTVKDLQGLDSEIEVRSGGISYSLAASQIDIDAISQQFGEDVALEDIDVNIRISNLNEEDVRVIEDAADSNNFLLVVPPVEFEITCESNGQTVSVSRFNSYVERTIPIPAGVDPSKITTGVIINADGTFSHVPTTIIIIDGVYYARINSLTNSTYSVIYNPFTFSDLNGYWAEDMINNMGARLIVKGTDDNMYEPELDITRAEFATMTVRALGLLPGTEPSRFFDVPSDEWYNGYVQTATEYGLITGYEVDEFGPNDRIIREDAMVIIARALKVIGIDVDLQEAEVNELLAPFMDVQNAFPYIRNSIAACLKAEVITGRYADAIEPKDYITRAEVAVILNRMLRNT